MGQYFVVANIDRRECSKGGKLGEFFLDPNSGYLYLLAIPLAELPSSSSYISRKNVDRFGSWAGGRMICVGDYAEEWPENCVSEQDFSDFGSKVKRPGKWMGYCEGIRIESPYQLEAQYPPTCVWVLRNLSKKQYVRSNGIPTINQDGMSYSSEEGLTADPGLGPVLLSLISWSQDSSISMSYENPKAGRGDNLAQGKWAGDKIDIRALDDVQEVMAEEGWEDISREQARRLYAIWLAECGTRDSPAFEEED